METQLIRLLDFQPVVGDQHHVPVSVQIETGTVTCVLGPSGCGKTSLLRAIHGEIGHKGNISGHRDSFMVYQNLDQLFPWMTVTRNILLANDAIPQADIVDIADRWGVGDLLDRSPLGLSGGERQRFALIRALLSGRDMILCDEPLSGVDAITREKIAREMVAEAHQRQITVVWVTHDWHEASILADQLVIYQNNQTKTFDPLTADEIHALILD